MYYELAEVKKYVSVNKKDGTERIKFQINLKKDSKFREPKEIALVDVADIEEIVKTLDVANVNELEATVKQHEEETIELNKQLLQYKEQLQELEDTAKSLASDVHKLTEEKIELQQELIKLEDKNEEIIQLQKEHKEEIGFKDSEIAELNYKLNNEKDYSKSLLVARSDLLNRNIFKRIANIEPESSKYVAELKKLPEKVEANVVNEEND